MLAGTAGYMAPEQAMGSRDLDHRADIYSLGATLYHAVVGRVPFTGRNALEVMVKHSREAPRPPLEAVPELDPALSELILRMLAKAPGQRFQTYEELIAALQRLTRAGGATKADRAESADRVDSGPRPGWTGIFSLFRRRESEEGR
jgi:serine/threonine-protein kinase